METEISLEHGRENIFAIEKPEMWTCEIYGLSGEYPVMWIRACTEGFAAKRELIFRGAYFFDGPTQWPGANFHVAPQEECVTLLESLGWLPNKMPEESRQDFLGYFYLVVAPSTLYKVRVLVQAAYLSGEPPPEFRNKK